MEILLEAAKKAMKVSEEMGTERLRMDTKLLNYFGDKEDFNVSFGERGILTPV